MLRLARRVEFALLLRATRSAEIRRYSSTQTERQHGPLNILFCGADEFSIYSLRALRELQREKTDKIAQIDVVCRPDKRVGRGLKQIQEVPIKSVASELGLNLHQIDTFKGWSPPSPVDLVIAVSFGLLVPARILSAAKYGGLNVHPSLLPDLRGPAPIIHTLLKRRSHTGVTLQTMHPSQFDRGAILDQTRPPGVPVPPRCAPEDLLKILGPLGSEMLCRGIEDGIFLPPLKSLNDGMLEAGHIDHAPKITPEDRHIDWNTWSADEILLRDRVLGRLWDNETHSRCFPDKSAKRITFHGPWFVQCGYHRSNTGGKPVAFTSDSEKNSGLTIETVDNQVISPSSATLEGEGKGKGLRALINGLLSEASAGES